MADPSWIESVHQRIMPYIHRTPIMTSRYLNNLLNAHLWFKCENFQKVGAFKSRGAVNAVFSAEEDEVLNGVCTHSSGNHAQALARAARLRNVPAYIVMPNNAPKVKVSAVEHYGGQITFCEPTLAARESTLETIRTRTGALEIHPYNHPDVIMGQATCIKEVYEDLEVTPDVVITPVGGGGLLSGTCLSTQCFSPETVVYAAEPTGANDAWKSMRAGEIVPSQNPNTVADGLLTSLGSNTWPIIRSSVKEILLAEDHFIIEAVKLIWERMKIIAEPSAAVPLAALLQAKAENKDGFFAQKHVVLVVSGGNLDPDHLPW
jgi:threonine dehydratase